MADAELQVIQFSIAAKRDIDEAIDQFIEDAGMQVGDETPEYEVRSISTAKGPYAFPASRNPPR